MAKKTGSRDLTVRVKTARGRKRSSTKWLQRQLNDPYVQQAKRDGYRSRAAYKLLEMDEKFHFLREGQRVLDLGAAPGGWSQVALKVIGDSGTLVGIDLLEMEPMAGATFIVKDFMDEDAPEAILKLVTDLSQGQQAESLVTEGVRPIAEDSSPKQGHNIKLDLVMSDMAANSTGHAPTDHLRIIALCELAYDFAIQVLAPGGVFLCKVLKGGTENQLLAQMKQHFEVVKHAKPSASRKDSAESYVIAMGFRGEQARNSD